MAFSFQNTVAYENSVSFDEFVKEGTNRREEFISSCRREFHNAVDRYFVFNTHAVTDQQLNERRNQVIIVIVRDRNSKKMSLLNHNFRRKKYTGHLLSVSEITG